MNKLIQKWKATPKPVKASLAYTICSILQKCLSFITLPLFTRLLTKAQYGQLTLYQSWQGIMSIFLTLNLAYGSFSTAMIKFDDDQEGYISSVEGICITLSLLFVVLYSLFGQVFNYFFELPPFFVYLTVFEILGTTSIQFWSGKKRFEYKYLSVVSVTLVMCILAPILAFLLIKCTPEKGYARITGYALINIVFGLYFLVLNIVRGKKTFNKRYWKYALEFNVPLIIYYLSQTIFNLSDRIMIGRFQGTDKAALYGVAYSLATVLTFVLNAVNNSYVPWFYGKIKEEKQTDNKSVSVYISLLIAILLSGVIWFAPEIILILAGNEYMESIYVIPPVAISMLLLFYSQLFISVEFYYEQKQKLAAASIASAISNIVLNLLLIKRFGYIAAAYTTLFSYILFVCFNCKSMKEVLNEQNVPDNMFNYKMLVLLFLVFCIISYAGVLLYRYLLVRIIITCVILLILYYYRKKVIVLFNTLKQK